MPQTSASCGDSTPNIQFHVAFSSVVFVLLMPFIGTAMPVAFALFLLAGIAPDFDDRQSIVHKISMIMLPLALSFIVAMQVMQDDATRFVAAVVTFAASAIIINRIPLSHRGKRSLHQWWLAGPAGLGGMAVAAGLAGSAEAFAAAALGYLSHLVVDKLFNKGHQL